MQLVNELVSQDRWDEAYSVLSKHAQQHRKDPEISCSFGVLCFNMGRYEEAERSLKQALDVDGNNADAHYNLVIAPQIKADQEMKRKYGLKKQLTRWLN